MDKAEQDVSVKQAALDGAADDQAKAAAQTALDQARKKSNQANAAKSDADLTLASRKSGLAAVDRAMTLAQATGTASANGTIESIGTQQANIEAIANAVTKIVEGTYNYGHSRDFCTALLADAASRDSNVNPESEVYGACVDLLKKGQMIYSPG